MAVKDKNVLPSANHAVEKICIALITAISQTGVVAFKYTPGYAFQVTRVRTYCLLKAGTVSGNCKISTRTPTALTFTSATENSTTLSTTLANVQGSATDALTIEYTTDGSGVLTNAYIIVEFRPQHMANEA